MNGDIGEVRQFLRNGAIHVRHLMQHVEHLLFCETEKVQACFKRCLFSCRMVASYAVSAYSLQHQLTTRLGVG